MSGRQQRVTVQPIVSYHPPESILVPRKLTPQRTLPSNQNIIFKYLQQGQPVSVWLYDVLDFRLEGKIIVSLPLTLSWRRLLGSRAQVLIVSRASMNS